MAYEGTQTSNRKIQEGSWNLFNGPQIYECADLADLKVRKYGNSTRI